MNWWQIRLRCRREALEEIEDLLLELGAQSLSIADAGDEPLYEPLPGETPLWSESVVTATFDPITDIAALEARLRDRFPSVADSGIETLPLAEQDWSESYKQHFEPIACAPGLWIVPSWCEPPEPEAINIRLDPGMAFGTGGHATTALCLAALAARPPTAASVIDYGCGSGILAIAALRLGAREVFAVDIDPQALRACEANLEANGIEAEGCRVMLPEALGDTQCDLLIANILAGPLLELAPDFARRVRKGGRILLSGILKPQAKTIQSAYAKQFDLDPAQSRGDWTCLGGVRK